MEPSLPIWQQHLMLFYQPLMPWINQQSRVGTRGRLVTGDESLTSSSFVLFYN
jgi:hypothetical protein